MHSSTLLPARVVLKAAAAGNFCNSNSNCRRNILRVFGNYEISAKAGFKTTTQIAAAANVVQVQPRGVQQKIEVGNVKLNYEKVGSGPHPILCLPGALGCIDADFGPQLQKLNRDKFTIVAWDPPGYGQSRPPDRDVSRKSIQEVLGIDAKFAHLLMKNLGFDKFSLIGWSDGAITAIIMASSFPESMRKIVLIAGQAGLTEADAETNTKFGSIDAMSDRMKKPLIDMYGEPYFRKTWESWMKVAVDSFKSGNTNLCFDELGKINCPTLVVHGVKDPMVSLEHANILHKNIKNSRLHVMPEGKHNLHLRYADEFNALAENFLLEDGTNHKTSKT